LTVDHDVLQVRPGLRDQGDGPITVGLRPEAFSIAAADDDVNTVEVTTDVVEMLGPETLVYFLAPVESAAPSDQRDQAKASDEEESILSGQGSTVMCARLVPPIRVPEGSAVRLKVDPALLYFFGAEGQAIH
jgi:ABC-type sugar transport system ATPase subunit